jgi:hypothetical protein
MQNRSFASQTVVSVSSSSTQKQPAHSGVARAAANAASTAKDDLARVFNTALISTQTNSRRDFSSELYELTESASFKAILSAVKQLARVQGIQERQAAEQVIQTFRKVDEIWGEYFFREGVDRMRNTRG